jgi:hypothetical protein
MTRSTVVSVLSIIVLLLGFAGRAHADAAADRAAIADSLNKLATMAHSLGKSAAGSDDRAVRKKFAPAATDIGDDLEALGRRAAKVDVAIETVVKGLGPIDKDAAQLVDLADEAEDKAERKNLRTQAQQLQNTISAAKKILEQYAAKKDDVKQAPAKPAAMADGAFNALVATVRGASFDDDKVAVVRDASKANWFTSNQVAALMGLLSFDEGKIEVAVAAWSHIVDPQNNFIVYNKLSFSSSKDTLRKRVAGK